MAHVVVFAGEYDLANKDGIRRMLRRLESSNDLVLDLTEVTFVDSTFISELIRLEKVRGAKNFDRATVVAPAKSVAGRLLDVVGLTSVFSVVETCAGERTGDSDSIVEFAPNGGELDARAGVFW